MFHLYTGDTVETMILRLWPDEALKKICDPMENFDGIKEIVDQMAELMYSHNGMGLAANQVGLNHRLFIMDRNGRLSTFINPEVLHTSGQSYDLEGCLSFPGISERVKRADTVLVKARDVHGDLIHVSLHGYEARCALHEIDHLNGLTWFDRMGPLQRKMARKRLKLPRA